MLKDLFQRVSYAFADLADTFDGTDRNILARFRRTCTHRRSGINRVQGCKIDRALSDAGSRATHAFGNAARSRTDAAPHLGSCPLGGILGFLFLSGSVGLRRLAERR